VVGFFLIAQALSGWFDRWGWFNNLSKIIQELVLLCSCVLIQASPAMT